MNTAFNAALKQSAAVRKELTALSKPTFSGTDAESGGSGGNSSGGLTPAALGSLSASLASFSRTLDEYGGLAKQELNAAKQEKAFERIRGFRAELHDFRAQLDALKAARDDAAQSHNRAELLGRRPFVSATPENPYAATSGGGATDAYGSPGSGSGQASREAHVLREQDFFASTHTALDEYIARGQAVLGDLSTQRDALKSTQRRLYSVANTLGVSGDTIRMVERRAREDKWVFWGGVVVFVLFCWLVLHYLR